VTNPAGEAKRWPDPRPRKRHCRVSDLVARGGRLRDDLSAHGAPRAPLPGRLRRRRSFTDCFVWGCANYSSRALDDRDATCRTRGDAVHAGLMGVLLRYRDVDGGHQCASRGNGPPALRIRRDRTTRSTCRRVGAGCGVEAVPFAARASFRLEAGGPRSATRSRSRRRKTCLLPKVNMCSGGP
jgi:hypothetical protein